VSYSCYEVYNNTLRAFKGLNFPYGVDEDSAYIITWLELYNLKGLKIFSSNLHKYDQKFDGIINYNISNNSFDLKNKSTLMVGPNLIDYILTKILKNNELFFEFNNCSYFIFFIPLLVKLINKNIFCIIKNKNNIVCSINKEKISITNCITENINVRKNFQIYFNKNQNLKYNLDININLNFSIQKLNVGLEPNKSDWEKISKIAFRTYVPESEKSRERGAGGGDDND
tara:strand:+ start:431 stop:1114 length:684 start_codon:yes stop_codon:yes gene_type:complete